MTEKAPMFKMFKSLKAGLTEILPGFVFALLLAQPVLDVISYWATQWEFTVLTTLARFAMFAAVMLYGFIISDKKRVYIITGAALVVYWALHVVACLKSPGGYASPFSDMSSFLRNIQLPMLTIVFITCFKKSDDIPSYVQKAFLINFIIMMHIMVLSYMTGTQVYTYGIYKKGLMGWCLVHNAQSAILSAITPLMLLYAYRKRSMQLFYATAFISFINLFFVGTRVDYFTIPAVAVVMIIFMMLSGEKKAGYYVILASITLLCLVCFRYSLVNENFQVHDYAMSTKQEAFEETVDIDIDDPDGDSSKTLPAHIDNDIFNSLDIKTQKGIYDLYHKYLGPMVQRFGFDRVFEKYDYSLVVSELSAQRQQKRYFAAMAWEDSNLLTKCFGYEYIVLVEDYTVTDKDGVETPTQIIYDLENDFPSIYYYGGYVGFAAFMLFIAYFGLLAIVGVITRFKRIVTVESGMVGVSYLLLLGTAYFAGYVFRRPNSSIYLSVILAYMYYLTVIRENVRLTDIFKIFSKNKNF